VSFTTPGLDLYVRDFSAGYLDTPEPDVLPPGATPDAANALFARILQGGDSNSVSMKKREGFRLVTPTAMSLGARVDGMEMYQAAGQNNVLLAGCDGTLYQFNNIDTMINVVSGFTAGNPLCFAFMNGQCIVTDGTFMQRIDSTLTAYDIGQIAPTGASTLSAVAGPGVTGTYEGVVVWYDPVANHESSPSAVSNAVVFANQTRRWTKPTGSPAANYTKWRVYVRRTDTNELNYFRAATFDVSSATGDETTSDGARVNIAPRPGENDPPPGAFQIVASWRGYLIGVLPNGSDLYFSKINDFQSWNPNDVFKVASGRAEIRSVSVVGENIIIQTQLQSFTLEGDRVPFKVVDLHGGSGNVSQQSQVVVTAEGFGARLYTWDIQNGPTATNGNTWARIANDKVQRIIGLINRSALEEIRVGTDPERHLVFWAFPLGTSTRLRTFLPYDYQLDTWLPPVTGLEFSAFTVFLNSTDGSLGCYMGDAWGRIYETFWGSTDGPPSDTTLIADVTGGTASTVTASGATFYTGFDALAGMSVAVRSPAGLWQFRRIQSNTATTITLDTTNDVAWTTTPAAGWTVVVGPIQWYWTLPVHDFGRPDRLKRGAFFTLAGRTSSGDHVVEVSARYNGAVAQSSRTVDYSFLAGGFAGVWGAGVWGISLWGNTAQRTRKQRVGRSFFQVQFRLANFYPGERVEIASFGLDGDVMPRRRTVGV
jgi:hypothetical protein